MLPPQSYVWKKMAWVAMIWLWLPAVAWALPSSQSPLPLSVTLTRAPASIFVQVNDRGHYLNKLKRSDTQLIARVWSRNRRGWHLIANHTLNKPNWRLVVTKSSQCGRSTGQRRLAIQLGLQRNFNWWNQDTQSWQQRFASVTQTSLTFLCGRLPQDHPPGTLTSAIQQNTTSARTAAPVPQPLAVEEQTFQLLKQTLQKESSDARRYQVLRDWTKKLNHRKLSPEQVAALLPLLKQSSFRLQVAKELVSVTQTPLYASQVVGLMKTFRSDSLKTQAALYYCKGLLDPLQNLRLSHLVKSPGMKQKLQQTCK